MVFLLVQGSQPAVAADFILNLDLETLYTSNVFLDQSQQWDLAAKPNIELAVDFADYWSAGYHGQLNTYLNHESLHSQWHELYVFVNPAWGKTNQNEFVLELSIETLQNQPEYRILNLIEPKIESKLNIEPMTWLGIRLATDTSYRWFQDDKTSNSLDIWATGALIFTLPTKTTLSPSFAYGMRLLLNQEKSARDNDRDDQIKLGLHVSQSLAENDGLQLSYVYFWPFGPSGLLEKKLTQVQFAYLGEDFIFRGHLLNIGYKTIFNNQITTGVFVQYEQRTYLEWKAVDGDGILMSEDRSDHRIIPSAFIDVIISPQKSDASNWQYGLRLDYRYIHQQSNSDWYNTQAHQAMLSFWLSS